ncbi:MAG TPA: hypothetical protein PKC18_01695 [Lacipirellulaceae bacterium]|nr:hypothetical protein [Lacipirellulaceae bacterium]
MATRSTKHKVLVSGSIDPDVFEALERHCRAHPSRSRSAVITQALRQLLSPDHQEERERVLTANLDRLYWHQHNQAGHERQELRTIKEMIALLVRTFYNHTPEIPESHRQAAAASGEKRFNQFLDVLVAQIAPGQSALERMPEPAVVTADDVLNPDDDANLDRLDGTDV